MEITPVNRNSEGMAVAPTKNPDKQAEQREVIQAVKAVNGAELLGPENELLFQLDRQSQRVVIRIVNRQTGDVISQVPQEYVLRLAEEYRRKEHDQ